MAIRKFYLNRFILIIIDYSFIRNYRSEYHKLAKNEKFIEITNFKMEQYKGNFCLFKGFEKNFGLDLCVSVQKPKTKRELFNLDNDDEDLTNDNDISAGLSPYKIEVKFFKAIKSTRTNDFY